MNQRRVEVALSPDVAYDRVYDATNQIGKVEEARRTTRTITGKARYGLNPVRYRVAVLSGLTPESAIIEIQGRGQDIWGVASRKVIDRLVALIDGRTVTAPANSQPAAPAIAAGSQEPSGSMSDEIGKLAQMNRDGILSDEEFGAAKRSLLGL
jgi:hypothetical protein